MPTDWFAPHPGYATGVDPLAPVREMLRLVDALHDAGLRVTLDVVFNHNAETPALGVRSLGVLDPGHYFRRWADGTLADGAGCGNEFASESLFGRRLIRDACRYWVERYRVDGFRFDLMGLIARPTREAVRADLDELDPSLMLYGEPWGAGPSPHPVLRKGFQRGSRIGVFNDVFRDCLRGSVFDPADPGALVSGDPDRVATALEGGIGPEPDGFASGPAEVVQYAECHDAHTLVGRLLASDPEGGEPAALDRSAAAALLLAMTPGAVFIHSGQEFGRTKMGVPNTFNRGDDLNNIHWTRKREHHPLFRHYRRALALRAAHPMFRPASADPDRAHAVPPRPPARGWQAR